MSYFLVLFSIFFLKGFGALSASAYVIGDIHHQLGNQLFQVAAAVSLAWDHGAQPLFPDFETEKKWDIPRNYKMVFWRVDKSKPSKKKKVKLFYQEPHFHYAKIPYVPNMRIRGYFQSEKYFKHNRERILDLFEPHPLILDYLNVRYGDILAHPLTVGVHIRTYLDEDPHHNEFVLNGADFVYKAMLLFPEDALFVICSDQIGWCKENLAHIKRNMRFIEGNKNYHDLFLMSLCTHNIISNSSFSWWSAYLNRNPDKIVVAPKKWFHPQWNMNTKDIIPEEWILLE